MLREVEIEARQTLKKYQKCQCQYDVLDFILTLLKQNHPMSTINLTDAKYRPGTGYVMNWPYRWDIYIKMRSNESISDEKAHIMSFHSNR